MNTNIVWFRQPAFLNPLSRKVMDIMVRDGGITHLTALHYGIGSVTKEVSRLRRAVPVGYTIGTVKRKDADGNKYTRWTLKKAAV